MLQNLIYIIPVAVILIIFTVGFAISRKAVANGRLPVSQQAPEHSGIYEAPGVNQNSSHPFGAVQSVIRGRVRYLFYGIMIISVMALGLWMLYFTDILTEYSETLLTKLIATVIMTGGILYGWRIISYITYRVNLRRTGFEVCSIHGKKAYEYKGADFYLEHTIEHKSQSVGYSPLFGKTGNYNFIWQCQITFRDGRKPVILKSSYYAGLKTKMQEAIDKLYHAS